MEIHIQDKTLRCFMICDESAHWSTQSQNFSEPCYINNCNLTCILCAHISLIWLILEIKIKSEFRIRSKFFNFFFTKNSWAKANTRLLFFSLFKLCTSIKIIVQFVLQ